MPHPFRSLGATALCLVVALSLVSPASAAVFTPNFIMTDADLRDSRGMTLDEVRNFLASRGSLGSAFAIDPADGLLKTAPQLIVDAARRYSVNPKYLLALLQKESSIVETSQPTKAQLDWAAGYALCDGCSKTSALALKYRGLGKQIDAGAGWIDWYYRTVNTRQLKTRPGVATVVSGTRVTPANTATAALYAYTPHLHGNRLLWSILNRWFSNGIVDLDFPDGTLVRNEKNGAVALMQGGRFRPITRRSILTSRFNEALIVDVNEYDFASLEARNPGPPVRFSEYALVRVENGDIYLLAGKDKRKIASAEAFAAVGFNPEEVEDATEADIADYHDAEPITADTVATLTSAGGFEGKLFRDPDSGGVYFVEFGVKRPIWDRAVLATNFPSLAIQPASRAQLEALPTGDPVLLKDGTLVKIPASPSVYVIANGLRRVIPDETTFTAYGYAFSRVVVVPMRVLALHAEGTPLMIGGQTTEASGL